MARRSVLFTPGDRREMLAGAPEAGADVLVFDLEDGVAPDAKADARETVRSVLSDPNFDLDAELLVRVNPVQSGEPADRATAASDVAALAPIANAVDGVVLPKVARAAEVRQLAGHLRRHGLPRSVLALIESAAGVHAAPEVADAGGTDGLIFGAEDLAADLGATRSDGGEEVSYARQRAVVAASRAGVDAVDTLWTKFDDVEGLRADAARAVDLGFDGKLAIHPDQVDPINEAFTPDPNEREWASRVLDARERVQGRGAFAVDGEMIDAPLVAQAERIAARARAAGDPIERE